MKRILVSLSFLSLFSLATLDANEPSVKGSEEVFNFKENEELMEEELSSLEKEILHSEQTSEVIELSSFEPDLSMPLSSLEGNTDPLFSTAEDPATVHISNALPSESLGLDTDASLADPFYEDTNTLEESILGSKGIEINLVQVFSASPFIYCLLLSLSLTAIAVWLYSMSKLKYQGNISDSFKTELRNKLAEQKWQEALDFCKNKQSLLPQLVASGLSWQKHGLPTMLENMKSEGKRSTVSSWQRLSLLQDIAIIAPMIGLLGTVLGMFYAFYDLNRSFESVANLFDGFGIAVGTTVAGIGVAILAMILHSTIKFRLIQSLARVEAEATSFVRQIQEPHQF